MSIANIDTQNIWQVIYQSQMKINRIDPSAATVNTSATSLPAVAEAGESFAASDVSELLSQLSVIQSSDTQSFQETMNSIVEELENASAETDDDYEAQMLSDLAERFKIAAETGDLSYILPAHVSGQDEAAENALPSSATSAASTDSAGAAVASAVTAVGSTGSSSGGTDTESAALQAADETSEAEDTEKTEGTGGAGGASKTSNSACIVCGASLSEDATVCPQCGAAQTDDILETSSDSASSAAGDIIAGTTTATTDADDQSEQAAINANTWKISQYLLNLSNKYDSGLSDVLSQFVTDDDTASSTFNSIRDIISSAAKNVSSELAG